jgi:hypothetical protein
MTKELQDELALFLSTSKVGGNYKLIPVQSGRNSQVFRVHHSSGDWLLKKYHQHPEDKRDRMGTEFRFLQFLWGKKIRQIPEPIICDKVHHLGIFSFLKGSCPKEVEPRHISQAVQFIHQINQFRESAGDSTLPSASEACFSVNEHLNSVEHRLKNLTSLEGDTELVKKAQEFVEKFLLRKWSQIKEHIEKVIRKKDFEESLSQEERILSPSDFGFHNTLESEQGDLSFIDFEYAGWDDPVKLICDFGCQPEIPVNKELWLQFLNKLSEKLEIPSISQRAKVLLPVYRIKWCCIMLNEFRSVGFTRRLHAGNNRINLLDLQLKKTQNYFNQHLQGKSWLM